EQADIGEQLELEPQLALLAGRAGLGGARRLIPRGLEVDVAAPAGAAARDGDASAGLGGIRRLHARGGVEDQGADRHFERETGAARAVLILVAAVLAALRLVVAAILEVEQRREVGVGNDEDAPAVAAIAARRSAAWYTILAPERGGAIAAVSS